MSDDVSKLAAFSGYYAMKGASGVAPGAFLSIDTTEQQSPAATTIVINVSMDGKSLSGSYPFGKGDSFDGKTLKMPGKLTLNFIRQFKDGQVATFSGMIGKVDVSGGTYFNSAPVSAFIGDYYDPTTKKKALSISAKEILFDYSVLSTNPSGQLQPVTSSSYAPTMFVLSFDNISHAVPAKFMLMLGTGGPLGLVCSAQDGGSPPQLAPKMLLSIF